MQSAESNGDVYAKKSVHMYGGLALVSSFVIGFLLCLLIWQLTTKKTKAPDSTTDALPVGKKVAIKHVLSDKYLQVLTGSTSGSSTVTASASSTSSDNAQWSVMASTNYPSAVVLHSVTSQDNTVGNLMIGGSPVTVSLTTGTVADTTAKEWYAIGASDGQVYLYCPAYGNCYTKDAFSAPSKKDLPSFGAGTKYVASFAENGTPNQNDKLAIGDEGSLFRIEILS